MRPSRVRVAGSHRVAPRFWCPRHRASAMVPARMKNYTLVQLDEVPPVTCPCGLSRRGLADDPGKVATIHLVDILEEARSHYHKKMHEIYLVLEGEGYLELDDERIPVRPMTSVLIKPGCRHRAVGNLRILNVPVPAFDPEDEWFD